MSQPNMSSEAEKTERDQLATYHQIENWGCTLFLTGILLVTKQAMDWKFEHPQAWAQIDQWAMLAPACIGLYGFLILLVVNWRSRKIRAAFFGKTSVKRRGWLGWLLALMPPTAGICATFLLGAKFCGEGGVVFVIAACIGVVARIYDFRKEGGSCPGETGDD